MSPCILNAIVQRSVVIPYIFVLAMYRLTNEMVKLLKKPSNKQV